MTYLTQADFRTADFRTFKAHSNPSGPAKAATRAFAGLLRLLDTPFARRQRAISCKAAELRGLTDEQLAQIGINRDAIIPHVLATCR